MRRGDEVIVRAYPDKRLRRILWEEHETYVLVCRPEMYEEAILQKSEPVSTMGFPKEDVLEVRSRRNGEPEENLNEAQGRQP